MMISHLLSTLVLTASVRLPSAMPIQETQKQAAPVAEQQTGVRVELSGPQQPTYIWAASEWTLKFDNRGVEGVPFNLDLLCPAGYGGARVTFEIVKDGKVVRWFTSRNFDLSSHCGGANDFIASGDSGELPVVLHGDMRFDLDAYARDEEVYTRFEPAFETPGSYTVTALLHWKANTIRSNPVKLEVGDAPAGCKHALEGLKELAQAGLCVDVQGMYTNYRSAGLERIAEFVEREKYTLYRAQLQIGVAQALLWFVQTHISFGNSRPWPAEVTAAFDRVKSLLVPRPPIDIGLERTFKLLSEAVAKQERERQ